MFLTDVAENDKRPPGAAANFAVDFESFHKMRFPLVEDQLLLFLDGAREPPSDESLCGHAETRHSDRTTASPYAMM
jgi:hypothetical protein